MHKLNVLLVLAAVLAALAVAGTATGATVTPVMTGLDNPRGLAFGPEGALYVTESGRGGSGPPCRIRFGSPFCYGPTGAISRLWRGKQEKWVTGLPSMAPTDGSTAENGPQDISFHGRGNAFVTMGMGGTAAERAELGPNLQLAGRLLKLSASGKIKEIADPLSYEAANNPAGGINDSNPFGVLALPGRQIVVDAGGNSVLEVTANGTMATLAAFGPRPNPIFPIGPPVVDSVETRVAQGPDGALYVSELTGVPFVTGFARIHRIAPDGTTSVYATGLTTVVDLAFAADGTLYALQHASCGPFFACPGSIVRVAGSGPHPVVYAGLSRPAGLTIGPDGAFYVSNNGASAGIGEVLRIQP
jgi:DNA-binding beta-propeller fold protein YncE